ncbi:MAG: hypothetical protein C4547_14085 [Phycisphaerales bacterium]|nr:MAG: hypothetical protein C4547_14085 [Phycisphaerales bacterium]
MKLTCSNLVPSQPDQIYERGGWAPRNGDGLGIGGFASITSMDDFSIPGDAVCDAFNRAGGPLGDNWKDIAPTCVIRSNAAVCGSRARSNFVGECGGPACNYLIKKSKAKACDVCPPKGGEFNSGVACEVVRDCVKKLKGTIPCPDGGNGTCKLKGRRSSCG